MTLRIQSLEAGYDENLVLHDINLSVRQGEVLGIIGPNGSGKSSLLRAISGVLRVRQGKVLWLDVDLLILPAKERARQLAIVPQAAQLPPAFSVWELISLGRTPHLNWLGQFGKKDTDRILWAMDVSETMPLKDRKVGELSGGEHQRVLLARALAQNCPILLLDEPTAHLDLHHQVAFMNLVSRMAREEGLAVLVAMHDLNLASLYANRLALLVEGRIKVSGKPKEVLSAEYLQEAYKVPIIVQTNPRGGSPWIFVNQKPDG